MPPKTIRHAVEHYRALLAELRRQEAADAVERLQRVSALNARVEQEQTRDKLRRYGLIV